MSDIAAIRTATALQLAAIDHRDADIGVILDDLDAAQLRAVARELLAVWCDISRWNYRGADMRRAVALDAEHLAVMPGDGHA